MEYAPTATSVAANGVTVEARHQRLLHQPVSPSPVTSPTKDPPTDPPTKQPTLANTNLPTDSPTSTSPTDPGPPTKQPTPPANTNLPIDSPGYIVSKTIVAVVRLSSTLEQTVAKSVLNNPTMLASGEWCWMVHHNYCGTKTFQVCTGLTQATGGFRRGVSELDARELCGNTCTLSGDCASGENCWGVQINTCDCSMSNRMLLRGGASGNSK